MKRTYWKRGKAVLLSLCFLTAFWAVGKKAHAEAGSGAGVELAHIHGSGCYHSHSGNEQSGGGCYGSPTTHVCGKSPESSAGCDYRCSVCHCDIVFDYNAQGFPVSGSMHCPNDRNHSLDKNWYLKCEDHGGWMSGWSNENKTCPRSVTVYGLSCGKSDGELECGYDTCGSLYITCADADKSVKETTLTANMISSGAGAEAVSFSWSTGQESQTVTVCENATYSCTLTYKDAVSGSLGSATAEYTVGHIDRIPPVVSLSADTCEPTSSGVTIRIEASDNVSVKEYSFDGEDFSDARELTVSENGTYRGYARDGAGNVGSAQITIANIDKGVPHMELSVENRDWHSRDGNNRIIVSAYDNESGLAPLPYSFEGRGWSAQSAYEIAEPGTYYVRVRDLAGNVAQGSITVSRIQDPAPTPRPTAAPTPEAIPQPTAQPAEQTAPEAALPAAETPFDAGKGAADMSEDGAQDKQIPAVTPKPTPAPTRKPSADTVRDDGGTDSASAGAGGKGGKDSGVPGDSTVADRAGAGENGDTDGSKDFGDMADPDGAEYGDTGDAGGDMPSFTDGEQDTQTVFVPNDTYLSPREDGSALLMKSEAETFGGMRRIAFLTVGAAAALGFAAFLWLAAFGVVVYTKDEKGRFRFAGITKVTVKENGKHTQVLLTKGIIRNSVTNELRLRIGMLCVKRRAGSRAELIYKTMSREFEIARIVFVRMRA